MNGAELRAALANQRSSVGVWVSIDNPATAVLVARAAFDWIVFDLEHGHFTLDTLRSSLDAVRHLGVAALVRVPSAERTVCSQVLDLGAAGLVVPMVNDADTARNAVRACRYPPLGARGLGAGRATDYGLDATEYFGRANSELVLVLQVEQSEAIENIDEIVAVQDVDALFIGPADLSASLGHFGDPQHDDVQTAIRRVVDACASGGRAVGMWCADAETAAAAAQDGMSMVVWTSDAGILGAAARSEFERFNTVNQHATRSIGDTR